MYRSFWDIAGTGWVWRPVSSYMESHGYPYCIVFNVPIGKTRTMFEREIADDMQPDNWSSLYYSPDVIVLFFSRHEDAVRVSLTFADRTNHDVIDLITG